MMNIRLKMREPKRFVEPEGPNFRRAQTVQSNLDGTHISFKAPRHRPAIVGEESTFPDRVYRSNANLFFRSLYNDQKADRGKKDHFERLKFFYHAWAFCGPWFSGALSDLSLSLDFVRAVNFPDSMSLFHPRAFEEVIGEHLTFMYSHHLSVTRDYIQEFDAPVNWQPLHHLPVNAVKLESVPRSFSAHKTISHLMFFPISDDVMARLHFMPSRLLGLPRSEMDKRVSAAPMYELMDNIINSIHLELSPEAKAQQARALAGLEDTGLVKNYPPLKWDNAPTGEEQKYINGGGKN